LINKDKTKAYDIKRRAVKSLVGCIMAVGQAAITADVMDFKLTSFLKILLLAACSNKQKPIHDKITFRL
jgi:hypothetical protein